MRMWTGTILTADREAYVRVVEETGMREHAEFEGHLGSWVTVRDLDAGYSEVVTFSIWSSREAIEAWAGYDIARAVFYPDEERYLIERSPFASHYDIVAGNPLPEPPHRA